jgi:hypothetical protein
MGCNTLKHSKKLLLILLNVICPTHQQRTGYTQNDDFAIIVQLTQVFTQIIGTPANCCSNIILIEGQFHYTALPPIFHL